MEERNSKITSSQERAHALVRGLQQWNCVPLALFFALKQNVVNTERLKSFKTFFNGIASELCNIGIDEDNIGFDEIVKAATLYRADRKAKGMQDYSKGTTDLYNAMLSEFGAVVYEID